MVCSWTAMVILAARLPDGAAKDLAGFLPACATMLRRLRTDPRVPGRAKAAVAFAGLWVLSPIDLIPAFLPVIGPLDNIVVLALALPYSGRSFPLEVIHEPWRADTDRIDGPLASPGSPGVPGSVRPCPR